MRRLLLLLLLPCARGQTSACAHSAPNTAIVVHGTDKSPPRERFLEYSSHGGFNNQRHCLLHALVMSYVLNRTLLAPPALSHTSSPHYGVCPSRIDSPEKLRSNFARVAGKKSHENCSLLSLLDIGQVGDLVRSTPRSSFLATHAAGTYSTAALMYDCSNTIWTFDSLRNKELTSCKSNGKAPAGSCKCRDVLKTLDKKTLAAKATVLSWGSTFKGVDEQSYLKAVPLEIRLRFTRASLSYSAPWRSVSKAAALKLSTGCFSSKETPRSSNKTAEPNYNYLSVHLRGSDGQFANRYHATINRAMAAVKAQLVANKIPDLERVCLFVATDMNHGKVTSSYEFKKGLANLGDAVNPANSKPVRVAFLSDVIKNPGMSLQAAYDRFSDDGLSVKCIPDVEMHLDLLIAANAKLGFGGSEGSSMSSSIRNLRKVLIADRKLLLTPKQEKR